MPRLIVNADELGLCRSTNDAIEECYQSGTVTSASVIVNLWDFSGAAAVARRNPGIDLGVHLNLTDGRPIAPIARVSSLVDARGEFWGRSQLLRRAWTYRVNTMEIEDEWRAQIQKCLSVGMCISHLDTHQHLHAFPPFSRLMAKLAREYHLPIRNLRERFISPIASWSELLRAPRYLMRMGRSMLWEISRLLAMRDIRMPDRLMSFHGVVGLSGKTLGISDLAWILDAMEGSETIEFVVHPGKCDADLISFCTDGVRQARQRESEWHLLTRVGARSLFERSGIELARFAGLL